MPVQQVRIIDVLVLGPFMVWFGYQSSLQNWARYTMIASGLFTMYYNWQRYQEKATNGVI